MAKTTTMKILYDIPDKLVPGTPLSAVYELDRDAYVIEYRVTENGVEAIRYMTVSGDNWRRAKYVIGVV